MGFTLEICACSISAEPFERFSFNFTQMFISVRCCAELMTRLQVMLHISWILWTIYIKLHSNVPLSKTVCRTHDSSMHTQAQGHTSRLWDSAAGDLAVLPTAVLILFIKIYKFKQDQMTPWPWSQCQSSHYGELNILCWAFTVRYIHSISTYLPCWYT